MLFVELFAIGNRASLGVLIFTQAVLGIDNLLYLGAQGVV
jgi:hypothetical protein